MTVQLPKNVSRALTYVLIVVVIVVGAQLVVGSALGSSPVYVVVSKSMVPTLQIGDLVITESVPFSSIHVGQVIVYEQPTASDCPNPVGLETIVHRVVNDHQLGPDNPGRRQEDATPTRTSPTSGPRCPPSASRASSSWRCPYLGLISMLIPYPWNYALVGLILLFVFLTELRPSRGGRKESQGEPSKVCSREGRHSAHFLGLAPNEASRRWCLIENVGRENGS